MPFLSKQTTQALDTHANLHGKVKDPVGKSPNQKHSFFASARYKWSAKFGIPFSSVSLLELNTCVVIAKPANPQRHQQEQACPQGDRQVTTTVLQRINDIP